MMNTNLWKQIVLTFILILLPTMIMAQTEVARRKTSTSYQKNNVNKHKSQIKKKKQSRRYHNSTISNKKTNENITFTVNGISFKMIAVEGGKFTMGMSSNEGDFLDYDRPAHDVIISDFLIGEIEVTQALWKAVMGSNPSEFKGDNLPVEMVSWDDCQIFIRKLNELTIEQRPKGKVFRLPTEAEWEFVGRGGNKSRHLKYVGGADNLQSVGWYKEDPRTGSTHPVAKKLPNELGIYDISGNVREWCQDWFGRDFYYDSPTSNPCNNTESTDRVIRGSSWTGDEETCHVAFRGYNKPSFKLWNLGLRLAM